ncbi:MAG: hypothetical protein M1837_007483 [Sclerophora amabilis]|nr:MAG: hypothetical protein M1837_007483 [Sclerophora amabilis]
MRFFAVTSLALVAYTSAQDDSDLPTADLGYTVQRASAFNSTARYYNFTNIRYAEPPVGNLRFAAPVPAKENRTLQTGDQGGSCYQATPARIEGATAFITSVLTGQNTSSFIGTSTSFGYDASSLPPPTAQESEDCLFLDVIVPEEIYKSRDEGEGAAVLVWIYGGGYVSGNKTEGADPAGLFARSVNATGEYVIFVSLNYRLGAFGWLAGPTLQSNGTANAGLLDQRLALEWVQHHIKSFGGNPKKVTVFGESAGGGSIMHQITAYGGARGPVPFQQALPQSPGWLPFPSNFQQETIFKRFLEIANVSTIQEARGLSSIALRNANCLQIDAADWISFVYGPVVDGEFVPGLPGKLLLQGAYDKNVSVMVGYNANEGLLFTPPAVQSSDGFSAYVRQNFPTADDSVVDYISGTLYPPVFDGSGGYTNNIERAALAASESVFSCNAKYLARAYRNSTYNYLYSVPPGLHGEDIPYTFFNGPNPSVLAPSVARALQGYITSFAVNGRPSAPGTPTFGVYGSEAEVQNLNITSIERIPDPLSEARCLWWQKALYY